MPAMKMARVILFTARIDEMSEFYGKVLGLRCVTNERMWREFQAGGARVALHSGPSSPGRKGPKIVFFAKDVEAIRKTIVARGAKFGKAKQFDKLVMCDGKDPDGNPIQLSNR
jgi:predicted enzyme related to lactoylglutathione lyase